VGGDDFVSCERERINRRTKEPSASDHISGRETQYIPQMTGEHNRARNPRLGKFYLGNGSKKTEGWTPPAPKEIFFLRGGP